MYKYPKFLPLFFYSDHGVNISSDIDPAILDLDKKSYFFCWNEQLIEKYNDYRNLRIIPTEHPYRIIIDRIPKNRKMEGTIFFPSHNAGGYVVAGIDDEDSISRISALPKDYFPVTVCLHATDYMTERREFFEKFGFHVIWFGDIHSQEFVIRLFSELAKYKYAVSEAWGSQVAYAVAIGIPTTIIPRNIEVHSIESSIQVLGDSDQFYSREKSKVDSLFSEYLGKVTPQQMEYINTRLGYHFRSRRLKNEALAYSLIFTIGIKWFFSDWLSQFFRFQNDE